MLSTGLALSRTIDSARLEWQDRPTPCLCGAVPLLIGRGDEWHENTGDAKNGTGVGHDVDATNVVFILLSLSMQLVVLLSILAPPPPPPKIIVPTKLSFDDEDMIMSMSMSMKTSNNQPTNKSWCVCLFYFVER